MRVDHGSPNGRRFIVAEISKTWTGEESADSAHVRELFEDCIERNLARGYVLHSWSYGSAAYPVRTHKWPVIAGEPIQPDEHDCAVQETIVAVFEFNDGGISRRQAVARVRELLEEEGKKR